MTNVNAHLVSCMHNQKERLRQRERWKERERERGGAENERHRIYLYDWSMFMNAWPKTMQVELFVRIYTFGNSTCMLFMVKRIVPSIKCQSIGKTDIRLFFSLIHDVKSLASLNNQQCNIRDDFLFEPLLFTDNLTDPKHWHIIIGRCF